jgi:hypothetical protein
MVTSWPNHWDRIGNKTSFTYGMLRGNIMNPEKLADNVSTTFIRIDRLTRLPRKCWEGKVAGIKRTADKVWFEFELERQIECPQKYVGYPEGWFADDES